MEKCPHHATGCKKNSSNFPIVADRSVDPNSSLLSHPLSPDVTVHGVIRVVLVRTVLE
jgi:hypothetical protein